MGGEGIFWVVCIFHFSLGSRVDSIARGRQVTKNRVQQCRGYSCLNTAMHNATPFID